MAPLTGGKRMEAKTEQDKQEELSIRAEEAAKLWGDTAVNTPVEEPTKAEPGANPEIEQNPAEEADPAGNADPAKEADPAGNADPAKEAGTGLSAIEQQLADLSKKINDLSQIEYRLKQAESRIGGINNRLRDEQLAAEKTKATAPTAEQIAQAQQTAAEWQQLTEDYPEWSKAVDSRFKAENEALKHKLAEIEQQVGNKSISPVQVQSLIEEAVLSSKYPNFLEDIESNDFKLWIQAQDDDTKTKYLKGTRAVDAIHVLDKFHGRAAAAAATASANAAATAATEIKNKRKQQLSVAALPSGGQPQQTMSKTEDQMSDSEYRKHLAAQYWPR
jgi:hypothetical protein